MLARSIFFVLLGLSVALLSCSKDRPAPVAPAGKSLAALAAPAAPTNLRFDAPTDSSCTVRWDASDGATDYDVNYKPAVGGRWTNEPHRGTRLYNTIHDLQPNTEYRWAVRAENSDGTSEWVFGPNFTTLPSEDDDVSNVPASPTNLRFDNLTATSCTVRWDASDGATDYDINYKLASGGRWINEPHTGDGLYNTIHDLEPDTEYRWAARAENSDGTSEWVFGPNFTTLPSEGGWIYWRENPVGNAPDLYYRANLDGSNVKHLSLLAGKTINELAIDTDKDQMHWIHPSNRSVWKATLKGENATEILHNDGIIGYPLLDVDGGQIFWAEEDPRGAYIFSRMDLDGNNTERIVSDVPVRSRFRITGVAKGSILYWNDEFKIRGASRVRAWLIDFDTEEVQRFTYMEELDFLPGLLWGVVEDQCIWENLSFGIWRTNLDFGSPMLIDDNTINTQRGSWDIFEDRVCWAGYENRDLVVRCADLSSGSVSNVFDFEEVPDIDFPQGTGPRYVALDVASEQIFWTFTSEPREVGLDIEYDYSLWQAKFNESEATKIFTKTTKNVEIWAATILALER